MKIWIIALIPAFLAVMALVKKEWLFRLAAIVNFGLLIYIMNIATKVAQIKSIDLAGGYIYLDSLSMVFLVVLAAVAFLVSLFAIFYFERAFRGGELALSKLMEYHFWINMLISSMYLVVLTPNLGIMWVAIEATTVTSVLLVGFGGKKASIEAAWKYVLICSVGIVFALIGIMLLHFSAIPELGNAGASLDWRKLLTIAPSLNKGMIKIAFIFILIGFGTKVGFAPMHTWLPDAYSQAPTPVSAILSGALVNCALYGILRTAAVVGVCAGTGFTHQFFTFFGILSLAVVVPFVIIQTDVKRLLAYSSVENIGIVSFALGIGGRWGLIGALMQITNHALAKAGLFMAAGEVTKIFHSKRIHRLKGLFRLSPILGGIFFSGFLILSGAPPFAIFLSKMTIVYAGISQKMVGLTLFFLLLLLLIFVGLLHHFCHIALGQPSSKILPQPVAPNLWLNLVLAAPIFALVLFSFYQPRVWQILINAAARIIGGAQV